MAGGEDGGEVCGHERAGPAPVDHTPRERQGVGGAVGVGRSRAAAAGRGERIHLHHRRRSIHVSPASETRASKRVEAGLKLAVRRDPDDEGVDQESSVGVFSGIRPMASCDPEPDLLAVGVELGPNQRVPFGSRVGSRGVRVRGPPGQSSRRPAMTRSPARRPTRLRVRPASATTAHRRALTSLRRIPATKRSPAVPGVEVRPPRQDGSPCHSLSLDVADRLPPDRCNDGGVAGEEGANRAARRQGRRCRPLAARGMAGARRVVGRTTGARS